MKHGVRNDISAEVVCPDACLSEATGDRARLDAHVVAKAVNVPIVQP